VKEEILTRRGELGVRVEGGALRFVPDLLEDRERLQAPATFRYYAVGGAERTVELPAGGLAFTLCQVPVVYAPAAAGWVRISCTDGSTVEHAGDRIDADLAAEIFARSGHVTGIRVGVPDPILGRLARQRTTGPAA
jgi:hypothetical protein